MHTKSIRWVLAFDASCATCRTISEAVRKDSDNKLEILPLTDTNVSQWRMESLGPQAAWEPTLLRIDNRGVKAWTGKKMAIRLARHLGPGSTVRVLRSLGRLNVAGTTESTRTGVTRAAFLQVAAGLSVAGSLILSNNASASPAGSARAWVEANRDRLPEKYADFVQQPMSHRRAIYGTLSPEKRSQLWIDHLKDYARKNENLSGKQLAVIDEVLAVAATVKVFTESSSSAVREQLDSIQRRVLSEFGQRDTDKLIHYLGGYTDTAGVQSSAADMAALDCDCNTVLNLCSACPNQKCLGPCTRSAVGCGPLWAYECNGICIRC